MAMRRPYPALEHLEVSFCDELQIYPQSSVQQLVAVTDDATTELRRRQERALLFEYARLPNPDEYPTGDPPGPHQGPEWDAHVPFHR
eukprot:2964692-Amphidinium_carterae.1